MARGIALEQLIKDLRSETGFSTNPAVSRSTKERFTHILNRVQRRLYGDHEWPFLRIYRDVLLQNGSRYYDFPTDIDMDRVIKVEVKYGGIWQKVKFGIDNLNINAVDSDLDVRLDPVQKWAYYLEDGSDNPQIEVWPIPATDGNATNLDNHVRVHGIQKLSEMVNKDDVCLLDGDLIVLYAASEILAKLKSSDAQAKLENANSLYTKLKGNQNKSDPFVVGGDTFDTNSSGHREIELRVAYAGQT